MLLTYKLLCFAPKADRTTATAPEHPVRTVVKRRMEKLVQRGIATLVIGLLLLWMMAGIAAVLFTVA